MGTLCIRVYMDMGVQQTPRLPVPLYMLHRSVFFHITLQYTMYPSLVPLPLPISFSASLCLSISHPRSLPVYVYVCLLSPGVSKSRLVSRFDRCRAYERKLSSRVQLRRLLVFYDLV